ncbi:hypothetical protein RCL1_002322 [Eukaryota sp. TZLM3-RCL]
MSSVPTEIVDLCIKYNLTYDFQSALPLSEKTSSDVTAPLHKVPYDEQMQIKHFLVEQALTSVSQSLISSPKPCPHWARTLDPTKPVCPITHFVSAPEPRQKYRNKVEFNFGSNSYDGPIILGFCSGPWHSRVYYDQNSTVVPDSFRNISQIITDFCNSPDLVSKYRPYSSKTSTGFWRTVTLREGDEGKMIVMIMVCENDVTNEEEKKEIRSKLSRHLIENCDKITGISWLVYNGTSTPLPSELNYELLYGDSKVVSSFCDLSFEVDIDAFLQVNTKAAELLYDQAINWCFGDVESQEKSILFLDVCCGTGTIGLCVKKKVQNSHVIGVDINPSSIVNAKRNALINQFDERSVEFHAGPAEEILDQLVTDFLANSDPIISDCHAIVDPPRSGLLKNASYALRKTSQLKSFVYMACKPSSLATCIVPLCRKAGQMVPGVPFRPVQACIVDLFPDTPHCECLILFERISIEEAELPDPGRILKGSDEKRKRRAFEHELRRKRKEIAQNLGSY